MWSGWPCVLRIASRRSPSSRTAPKTSASAIEGSRTIASGRPPPAPPPRRQALAGDHVRAQGVDRQERVGEVPRVVVETAPLADAPADLGPADDGVPVCLGGARGGRGVPPRLAG